MSEVVGPLSGVTVIDLTRVLAGPTCTQMLGDLGADVIKFERVGNGDDTRKFAPPFVKDAKGSDTSESSYFMGANRNKRSIAVDIAKPEGANLIRRMATKADALVENFKTGNLAKYGLGYNDLKLLNPKLVYCSVTGFGQTGPYASRPGYDFLVQGMGGLMSITGEPDGEPQKVGVPIADIMAGMYAGVAVNAALRHAAVTGQGQYIDIGMMDTTVAMLANAGMNYIHGGMLGRLGNAHPNIVPYQPFKTADGFIIVAIGNDTVKMGYASGSSNIAGTTAIGHSAGERNQSFGSTFIGWNAGSTVQNYDSSGDYHNEELHSNNAARCVIIGGNAGTSAVSVTNEIVIGFGAKGKGTNTVVIGNNATTSWLPHDDNGVDLGSTTESFKDAYIQSALKIGDTSGSTYFQLPSTIGTEAQVLKVPASGNTLEWGAADSIPHIREGANFGGSLLIGFYTGQYPTNSVSSIGLNIKF